LADRARVRFFPTATFHVIGILVIAHGNLGEALIQCATHVLGKQPERVANIAVAGRTDPDTLLDQAEQSITALDDGHGVLILTDMVGGTPSNVATRAIVPGRVEVVSGVSLPMLVRALTYRNGSLAALVAKAISGGRDGVVQLHP
jgi:mannose PTS system EIIA component